jgi:hypothetical protein
MPLNVRKYISLIDHNCLINHTVHMDTRHYTIIRTYIQHVLTDLTCPCTFLWHIHAAVLNRPTPIPLVWFPVATGEWKCISKAPLSALEGHNQVNAIMGLYLQNSLPHNLIKPVPLNRDEWALGNEFNSCVKVLTT